MNTSDLEQWLEKLKDTWETKQPKKILDLCSNDIHWYETPFTDPYKNREEVLNDWKGILNQDNISFNYEVLSVRDNVGIAHWAASFTKSEEKFLLDGIFKISLNEKGECTEFRQWVEIKKE